MRIGRVLLLVAAVVVGAGAALATGCAQPAPPDGAATAAVAAVRARVRAGSPSLRRLLAAEGAAPTAAELRGAGADAASLIALASDESVQPLVRTRALAALRHFPGGATTAFLTAQSTRAASRYARTLAARALAGSALPAQAPER